MVINYTLTKEDYIQFNLKQLSASNKNRRRMALQMMVPMVLTLAIFLFYFFKGSLKVSTGIILTVLFLAWPFIYIYTFKRAVKKRLNQFIDQNLEDLNLGDKTLTITDKGLKDSESFRAFKNLYRIEESQGYYFFHQTDSAAIILPKRALSPQEDQELKAILAGYGLGAQ
ncbi:MAG: YcxB family protein [Tissierellia bacterium]|nr:YcxB family protein [Tissierellia bacterium]